MAHRPGYNNPVASRIILAIDFIERHNHLFIIIASGYMLNPLISPGSLEDFVERVIPELRKREWYLPFSVTGRRRQLAGFSLLGRFDKGL